MGAPSVLTVVLTGILLVFFLLLLLTAIIMIFGRVMGAVSKPKVVEAAPTPVPTPVPVATPVVTETATTDDTEIIAVISAAVAAMGAGTVVSVTKQQSAQPVKGNAVNAWKQSSILSYLQQV